MTYPALHILGYLYWILLLLVTAGSLVFAVLAFRLHKRVFTIISAGALAAALFIAAAPAPRDDTGLDVLLGMLALALAVIGGGPVAVLTLQLATRGSVSPGNYGGIMVENDGGEAAGDTRPLQVHEVLRGGLTIGILERLAVAGAILAGFPEAIAVVVAIKGVGRFTELAASEARERFIIGTLASLIWASACAALVTVVNG
ncbi:hypothetical protein [Cryobacterium tepidiphilum]|uniref:Uncharacterized protein n=1 Tax=Cryobacterium tepidiphilum TaxID=2486026 RepID=A0A3M8LC76_9MICO|nr:hypothetical protein [Cryobacterium tepidiphilum]RNE62539.1 hypothetical protein EEJ31_07935 [Cryobacterium tepidiphilum]